MAGCSGEKGTPPAAATTPAAPATPAEDAPLPPLAYESELSDEVRAELNEIVQGRS